MSWGSRFTPGGYQGPATNAAALTRGRPDRALEWRRGELTINLELIPLTGGRPELFEVCYRWNDTAAKRSMYCPCMVRGEQLAREAFALTARELNAGRLPEAVITAPGTPLGP